MINFLIIDVITEINIAYVGHRSLIHAVFSVLSKDSGLMGYGEVSLSGFLSFKEFRRTAFHLRSKKYSSSWPY